VLDVPVAWVGLEIRGYRSSTLWQDLRILGKNSLSAVTFVIIGVLLAMGAIIIALLTLLDRASGQSDLQDMCATGTGFVACGMSTPLTIITL
jgi:hypothetical protein